MSTVVADIRTGIEGRVATLLGASYQKLRRFYTAEQNTQRGAEKGYAVIEGAASDASSEGTFKFYTLDQEFQIIIVDTIARDTEDSFKQTVAEELYDKADEMLVDFLGSGLGTISVTNGIILTTNSPSISEPEFLENNSVLLRVSLNVKYRRQFT